MAVDYCVAHECEPKRHFGKGDGLAGTGEILDRLKSMHRAAMLTKLAKQEGQDPSQLKVTLHVPDGDGNPIEKEVSLTELAAHARPLKKPAIACKQCPARCQNRPYGCFGAVHYPISAAAENWLLSRLQPLGTIGAKLCLEFMAEFGVKGESIHQMRQSGFFESAKPPKVVFKIGFLKRVSVTADQLLETLFMVGDALNPNHCFGVL